MRLVLKEMIGALLVYDYAGRGDLATYFDIPLRKPEGNSIQIKTHLEKQAVRHSCRI